MNEYVFALGREAELSVAELEAVFLPQSRVEVLHPTVALVQTTRDLGGRFIDRLGGTIKISAVIARLPKEGTPVATLAAWLTPEMLEQHLPPTGREVGFSLYAGTPTDRRQLQALALERKKNLREGGRSIRVVSSKEEQLSAVTVDKEHLVTQGREFVIVVQPTEILVATTVSVQDYHAYSLRDYGRPVADAKRGMLPPKLAQMMLNIGHIVPEDILLDPFCGLGTVLQEAALLGVKKMYGSDADQPAVRGAQENIRWLLKEYPQFDTDVELTRRDAREMPLRPTIIVTEPDLGRPMRGHEPITFVEREARRLETMYAQVFETWQSQLPIGTRVVMVWPEFVVGEQTVELHLERRVRECGFQPDELLQPMSAQRLGVRQPQVLTYARSQARIRRQIRFWTKT